MSKIKLTKGELKKQRDSLRQYQRYLPTLQLKKQQLQIEILRSTQASEEKGHLLAVKRGAIEIWSGLFQADPFIDVSSILKMKQVITGAKNIAGVDIPTFEGVEFSLTEYDLFLTPIWVDVAVEALEAAASLEKEIEVIKKGIVILRQELHITAQRVNLFEKVKIPEAEEAIRLIKIYLGDQMANAVGRSKIAKKKIEQAVFYEVSLATA